MPDPRSIVRLRITLAPSSAASGQVPPFASPGAKGFNGKSTALALCLGTDVVAHRYMQAKAYIDRFAAVFLGALGFRLLRSRADAP